jgi:hypothetical protein
MRRRAILLVLVVSTCFARTATHDEPVRVTVQQLQQFIQEQQAEHVSDRDLAQKLAGAELSEQLTESKLDQMKTELKLGEETVTELNILADLSAFLEPPAAEKPVKEPPDVAAQKDIIRAAQSFAEVTLKRLPDFLATRTTRSFEDIPIEIEDGAAQSGMHPVRTLVREVAYRNGMEISRDAAAAQSSGDPRKASLPTLSSAGEYGPALTIVLGDSAHGTIAWSHWEQTSAGMVAVFHYDVPKEESHYQVDFCCALDLEKREYVSFHGKPAYSGSISVDPATGDVLRLALQAQVGDFDPALQLGFLVSYGEVEVEGKRLICPLHSAVTLRSEWVFQKRVRRLIRVNDVVFTAYRRFGSTARIVTNQPVQ